MSLIGAAKTKRHWYEIIIRYFRSVEGHGAIIFFFLYIFLQGLHVSVLVKSVAFLTVLPLSTLYTLLLITFWLFAKGQWSCISNIRFRKARKKGSLIYLLRVIFMFMLILMCIKKKRKKKNKIHLEFYRFVYRGLQRRNTAMLTFSFRSIFYVIYTEIRNANTFLLLQFLQFQLTHNALLYWSILFVLWISFKKIIASLRRDFSLLIGLFIGQQLRLTLAILNINNDKSLLSLSWLSDQA